MSKKPWHLVSENILLPWLVWLDGLSVGPANKKVTDLISHGQGTRLGCGPGPWLGVYERQLMDVSLPPFLSPFPLSLK